MNKKIDVLDKGYVILQDKLGTDLTVVNSARVSYNRKKEVMDEKDKGLINYLTRKKEYSPFRHAMLQFEFYAPLMVTRQHWKYVVGSNHTMDAWNETSRRYVKENNEFYIPDYGEWRSAPKHSKQGSGAYLGDWIGAELTENLLAYVDEGERLYLRALEQGVAPEQARLFLPSYGLYIRYYWTASLESVAHFLRQRLEEDAQKEIRDYAEAVKKLAEHEFPLTLNKLLK